MVTAGKVNLKFATTGPVTHPGHLRLKVGRRLAPAQLLKAASTRETTRAPRSPAANARSAVAPPSWPTHQAYRSKTAPLRSGRDYPGASAARRSSLAAPPTPSPAHPAAPLAPGS